ncbi:MAG TPA: YciI family protein [Solirubrobacterales bacterium]|nr:YciI family protein [Solirubrobacterales bacterium]
MKFMFVIHHDEKVLDAMPEKQRQDLVDSAIEYAEEIRRSGHFIVSQALQRTSTARTIRVHAGKVTATDGPFAETKEQVGGFFVIEAKDLDEACAIASRFPPLRVGVIEVRPVQELSHSRDRRGLPN